MFVLLLPYVCTINTYQVPDTNVTVSATVSYSNRSSSRSIIPGMYITHEYRTTQVTRRLFGLGPCFAVFYFMGFRWFSCFFRGFSWVVLVFRVLFISVFVVLVGFRGFSIFCFCNLVFSVCISVCFVLFRAVFGRASSDFSSLRRFSLGLEGFVGF